MNGNDQKKKLDWLHVSAGIRWLSHSPSECVKGVGRRRQRDIGACQKTNARAAAGQLLLVAVVFLNAHYQNGIERETKPK